MPVREGSWIARWHGLAGLAVRRVVARITQTERRQTLLTVAGIAVAVAVMLIVTSVGLGMLAQSTVGNEDTDYWIVPEGTASSTITDVERQQLGQVHMVTERIEQRAGVEHVTPVLMALVRANASTTADSTSLIVLGVIPSPTRETLVGLPMGRLTPGDPYYANGSYEGSRTGEAVLSTGGAETLGISRGESLVFQRRGTDTNQSRFSTVAVSETRGIGIGQLPVAIVHLSELQRITGADSTDSADQILVAASATDVRADLEGIYPGTEVVTRRGLLLQQSKRSKLPVAISLSAFVVAVVVGTLFLSTTLGMELAAGSRKRAILSALGFSPGSRVGVVVLQALVITFLGGSTGVVLATLGIAVTNALATTFLSDVPIATFRLVLVPYGLGVALLIGLLSLPYLVVVSMRSTTMEALTR